MKRILCLLLMTLLTGCSTPEMDIPGTDIPAQEPETAVEIPAVDELYQDAPLPEEYKGIPVQERELGQGGLLGYPSLDGLAQRADTILLAVVEQFENHPFDGGYGACGGTVVTLSVKETLRGEPQPGQTVRLFVQEGYMEPAGGRVEYSRKVSARLPVLQKEYLFFLTQDGMQALSTEYWELYGDRFGMMQLLSDGETLAYEPYETPNRVRTMTLVQLQDLLDRQPPVQWDDLYQDAPLPEEYTGRATRRSSMIVDLAYMPSLEEGLQRADTIVRASAIEYHNIPPESYDGFPWTSVTLTVSECLRGDVETGETVQMYAMEGWSMGADGVAVYSTLRFGGLPVQGKEYILCMARTQDEAVPDGSFERLCGRHAMLQILDDGETLAYEPYEEPETVRTMTMAELTDMVSAQAGNN